MILLSIGLPSDFAAACDSLTARLAGAELLHGETVADIGRALVRLARPNLVVAARRPDAALRDLAGSGGTRVLVVADDPRRAVRDLLRVHDLATATRIAASSCAALVAAAELPGATTLSHEALGERLAAALAAALGFAVAAAAPLTADPIETWWGGLDPAARTLVDGALGGYRERFRSGRLGELVWDRNLLWLAGDPGRSAGSAIDLAGAPRDLIHGPDIDLPAGRWAGSLSLGVSREALGIGLVAEIAAGAQRHPLVQAAIAPDGRGIGSAMLAFTIDRATPQPIALRLALPAPAPGGRLALGNLILTPESAEMDGISAELTGALGA